MTGYAALDWASAQVETDRLLLRPWRPEDADSPFADAAVRCWSGPDGSGLRAAVTGRDSGRLVGSAELRIDGADPGTARAALWIARADRRQGLGTEVTEGLCSYGFRHGISRMELLVAATDEPGLRLAARAGFRREGLLRSAVRDGALRTDGVLLSRLAADPPSVAPQGLPDAGELTDGVVTVRMVRPGDEAAVLDERVDPLTRRWATTARLWTPQDARAYVAAAPAAWLAGTEARFAIVDAASGTYAGSLGLRITEPAFRVAEIGYGLRPAWRGRGLTTRAVRLVAGWAFTRAGIARLEIGAAVGNHASRRVAERAGFRPEGIAPLRLTTSDGGRADEARYGLLPPV